MKNSTALLTLLAVLMCALPAAAVEKLYFSDIGGDKILRCDLNGSNLEELVVSGLEAAGDIAIDRGGGRMYWTDWSSGTSNIRRANLDGTNVEILLTGLSGPWGIALDVAAGKMYWTEFGSDKIRRANLDGTAIEDLVTTGLTHPNGIVLDLAAGKMYFGEGTTQYSAKIMRANLDGTMVEILVENPLIAPADMALDAAGDWLYWADLGTDSWFRSHLDGTGLEEILLSAYGTPIGVTLDLAAGKMYVCEYGGSDSEIRRTNLDGTGMEVILSSGVGALYGLTLGPAEAACSATWMAGPWLALVTGVAPYDYAVYLIFDGIGTITEMGAFNVPDPAGTFAVETNCDLTGELWSDGYVPFTGHLHSETTAEMDIGGGPMELLKVTNPGALSACWKGVFVLEPTGVGWYATLDIDQTGSISSSTGFTGPVTGRIFAEPGDPADYLAGYLAILKPNSSVDEIMFQEAFVEGDSLMWGSFQMDVEAGSMNGSFELHLCSPSPVGDDLPPESSVLMRNYPNPFNPSTTLYFQLPETIAVSLRVFDTSGRLVRTLLDDQVLEAGLRQVLWNGRDDQGLPVSSSVYFGSLEAKGISATNRMVLIR